MDVTVLAIQDCPGAELLERRLAAVTGLPGIQVTRCVITGQAQAIETGMRGSPTMLVNGTDPFAQPGQQPGQQPGLACRLYQQDDGSLAPAPSTGQLYRALTQS